MTKKDDFVRYTIRVPTELYEKLQKAAGMKSVNAEVVERLEQSFKPHRRGVDWNDPEVMEAMRHAASYAAREAVTEVMALNPSVREPPPRFKQGEESHAAKAKRVTKVDAPD